MDQSKWVWFLLLLILLVWLFTTRRIAATVNAISGRT